MILLITLKTNLKKIVLDKKFIKHMFLTSIKLFLRKFASYVKFQKMFETGKKFSNKRIQIPNFFQLQFFIFNITSSHHSHKKALEKTIKNSIRWLEEQGGRRIAYYEHLINNPILQLRIHTVEQTRPSHLSSLQRRTTSKT